MKKLMTILLVITTVLAASARNQMVKKTFRIEDFNAIRCEFVADIYYTQGKSYSVEAQASEKIMNMVSIHKKGNTLVIAKKKGNKESNKNEKRLQLYVTAPEINDLQIPGVADLHAKEMDVEDFSLNVKGVSRFECENLTCKSFVSSTPGVNKSHATIHAQTARFDCSGVDKSTLCIYADDLHLQSSGVSKQTVEFKGKKVDIQNSGVGTIHITMECTSLKARNSGVGKLILSGTADQTEINSNGVNKIDATELNKF